MKKIFLFLLVSSIMFASTLRITKNDGYVFAKTKKQIEKVISLSNSKDYEALEEYVNNLELKGEGGILKGGLQVYIESSSWGLVEIRVKGTTETWWTIMEALKK